MLKTVFITKSPCFFYGKIWFRKECWVKGAWFDLGLELLRGVERDIKMLKTAFIMKSPCLFLEKITLKKRNGVKGHGLT